MNSKEQQEVPAKDEKQVSRREFCNRLAVTSAAIAVAAQSINGQSVGSGNQLRQQPMIVYPPQKIEGAERLLPGSSMYFTYPSASDPAILVRANDGMYFAYSQKCTHLGCSIYFNAGQKCLECPCHKGSYQLQSGEVMFGPPQRPLDLINIQVRAGGELWAVGKTVGAREQYAKK